MKKPEGRITQQQQIEYILQKAQRMRVPLRNSFVQQGTRKESLPGPLAKLVRNRDELALDLYLLVVAGATKEPHDVILGAGAWARALQPNKTVSTVRVSRALGRLARLRLIKKWRSGRKAVIRLLKEDGSGEAYTRPPISKTDFYFQVPAEYWREQWHRKLSLAAKATLLISLQRGPNFNLPGEKAARWYGISADTVERGFAELEKAGLMEHKWDWRVDFSSNQGFTRYYERNLKAPFDRATRNRRRTSVEREGVRMKVVK